jgi:D-alanyl-lipoteichoic acid acyltransferase DltB (MBOAT superfamily)
VLFHTLEFAILLSLVWPAYLLLRRLALQNLLLLAASYVFYGWWEWRYIPLLLFSTIVDYCVGRLLDRTAHPGRRRFLLGASCVSNLGLLGFFKYWGLFASTSNGIAARLGLQGVLPELHILLPIGISFYTFQSMAYTIEVYRGQFPAWRSFSEFAAYISFFPQLVAGPIERPHNLLRAIAAPRSVTWEGIEEGVFLFAKGWLVKAIADVLGTITDPVFASPTGHGAWMLLWGMYAFIFQIYCDFLGYSQMARGIARLFGFRLMENFRAPFFAPDIRQLWARWHISLTSWLRDYLYRPLGGDHGGRVCVTLNVFATMFLAGLWHGAAWHFAVWGASFGIAMILHRALLHPGARRRQRYLANRPMLRGLWLALGTLASFHVFALSGVLFRAQTNATATDWQNALAHYAGILRAPFEAWQAPPQAMWVIAIVIAFDLLQLWRGSSYWSERWPWPVRGVVIGLLIVSAMVFDSPSPQAFIYFQF